MSLRVLNLWHHTWRKAIAYKRNQNNTVFLLQNLKQNNNKKYYLT